MKDGEQHRVNGWDNFSCLQLPQETFQEAFEAFKVGSQNQYTFCTQLQNCFLFLALENYRALKIKNSVIANNGQYCEKVFSTCQVVENFGLVTLVSLTFDTH